MRITNTIEKIEFCLNTSQGCGTVWFKTAEQAKAALKKDGIITGRDLADCTKCSCYYSYDTEKWKKHSEYLCHTAKKQYADQGILILRVGRLKKRTIL